MFRASSGSSSRQSDGKPENAPTGIRTPASRFMTWDAIHYTIRMFELECPLPGRGSIYTLCLTDQCACSREARRRRCAASARRRR
eukprot:5165215-Prymnesium_polylepis.1